MKEILVVDDDIQIGNVMEKVLSEEGYAVSRAYSGTEVLLFLKGHRPDLILLDLMLPGFFSVWKKSFGQRDPKSQKKDRGGCGNAFHLSGYDGGGQSESAEPDSGESHR